MIGLDGVRSWADTEGPYRYKLGRQWDEAATPATFIMLNPSTADALTDDPTVRRCAGFARSWGCGGLRIVNLCAYRATSPDVLHEAADAGIDVVGPRNIAMLELMLASAPGPIVAAWGAHADRLARRPRIAAVLELLAGAVAELGPVGHCLGRTASGQPRHPLYLKANTPLEAWP